ncbi:DNA-binding protein YbiB [Rahnella victoriana]|jgi:anthranilate phosphoribosyltransferase|uniref:DNA-binding protein YbiB n=1 Tax=Rahnella victoriana TaxID=1510570 RepID=UPI000BB1B1C4|nr:DNA-binding protein YbiB [Rahnella victoriana]PBI79896.1 DNA-binding protein YbiB [Rahnella victoriana]
MDYTKLIKEVGRGKNHARDLDREQSHALYREMLAGEVPDLQLGALLIAFRIKGEAEEEMLGFYQAMEESVMRLQAPADRPLPVVIPTYNGARKQANLTPLLAILLSRLGLPVLVHGVDEDPTRITSAEIFRALGIPAAQNQQEAQQQLDAARGPVFVPISVLCAPIEKQLALRWQMGVRNSSHTLAKLITPFTGQDCLRLSSVSHPEYVQRVSSFFRQIDGRALLTQGTEGEVYANPSRFPQTHLIAAGVQQVLAEKEEIFAADVPASKDVATTVEYINQCLNGGRAIPQAIITQLACCLVAAEVCADMVEARMIVDQIF